jgi:dTMP kinase
MAFITFEGIDGSGKSSLIELLAQKLKSLGQTVELTREPGGSDLGRELRAILLRTDGDHPCPEAELLIYEADRAQHVSKKIKPWLARGAWVLSDRFSDSSLAFQGAGRKIPVEKIKWLNQFATGDTKPDLTVLLDCDVSISHARRQKREAAQLVAADRFEQEKEDFHRAVREEYLRIAKAEPDRFLVLDATGSPSELLEELLKCLKLRKLLP